jgi:DNA-binding transcriptional MerR regulator
MAEERQIVYGPKELASLLGIEPVTLRNYAKIMESKGYIFHKNERGQRGYIERDIVAFKKFIAYKEKPGMTLERSADAVISWVHDQNKAVSAMEMERKKKDMERSDLLEQFEQFKAQQLEFNQQLLAKLEAQQRYIEESLNKRDQQLVEVMKDMLETKKQVAIAESPPVQKKKWWRFW